LLTGGCGSIIIVHNRLGHRDLGPTEILSRGQGKTSSAVRYPGIEFENVAGWLMARLRLTDIQLSFQKPAIRE
jgi:hypothetical protein